MAKMEAGEMEYAFEPVVPEALVARTVQACNGLFAEGGAVSFASRVDANLPTLLGDEDRLQQVLTNLVSNAAKFTKKGSVTLFAQRHEAGVRLGVADTGPGISVADKAAVFERFRQVGAVKGRCSVRDSYSVTPRDQTSVRRSSRTRWASSCSLLTPLKARFSA